MLCLVPRDLAPQLLEPLRRHYADDPTIDVLVERRSGDRRSGKDRRQRDSGPPEGAEDRRLIRNADGRRVGESRAPLIAIDPPGELPRKARPYADRIVFCERIPLSPEREEDLDTARHVTRFQAGDEDAFPALYRRHFDRIYAYLRVTLRDSHEAEDLTQQVFTQAFEALPAYERRTQPFRAWLFTIARNRAVDHLRRRGRSELTDPELLSQRQDLSASRDGAGEAEFALSWIGDGDLMIFIERLPLAQRQVLVLRYLVGLSTEEICQVLDRNSSDIRVLQSRALRFLRQRLTAIGRDPRRDKRSRSVRCGRQAIVLRRRRFALMRR